VAAQRRTVAGLLPLEPLSVAPEGAAVEGKRQIADTVSRRALHVRERLMDDDIFINCTQYRTSINVTGNPNNPTLRVEGTVSK
jgi:hypothetical protein